MRKIWLIIKREYITRVRKRAFLVTTLIVPILSVAAMIGIAFLSGASEENLSLAVKDESGLFENKVRGLDKSNLNFKYFGPGSISKDSLLNTYSTRNYDGLLYIPAIDESLLSSQDYLPQLSYFSGQTIGSKTKYYIESELSEVVRKQLISLEELDESILDKLDRKLEIQAVIGDDSEVGSITDIATAIGYLIAFIIYIYLFAYGAMVMRSVMEEKTNRIVEVIITTVKPFQLMMGKILGIGAVGLTQLLIWGIVFNVLYLSAGLIIGPELETSSQTMMNSEMAQYDQQEINDIAQGILSDLSKINWFRVISGFLFYFFFGYILYASQFAAIGAAATDDGDVQTLMFPISIPIIISIVIMVTTIEQPNSGLAVWASMIPLTSPVVMMSRIPFEISWWQQIISMLILLSSSIGMVWVAGRVYRIGILIQGQKVSFGKIMKWMIGR